MPTCYVCRRGGDHGDRALDPAGEVPAGEQGHQDRDGRGQPPGQDDRDREGFFDVGCFVRIVVDAGLAEVVVENARGQRGGDEPRAGRAPDDHAGHGQEQTGTEAETGDASSTTRPGYGRIRR